MGLTTQGETMTTQKIQTTYSDDVRLALLEQAVININDTLVRFEKRFDKIDERFDKIDQRMTSDFRWIVTIFGGLLLGLSGVMAHGFHWF
jgi:hypothetical protein